MMGGSSVLVTAEWALWGLDPKEHVGYHMLACSTGKLTRQNFEQILDRFSPGRLDTLPQVTMNYVLVRDGSRYLGMAVYEAPPGAAERSTLAVTTRYFCFPYEEVAAGAVSYRAMYEAIRGIEIPSADGAPCVVEMAGDQVAATTESVELTAPIAALLLTGDPVCMVDPGSASVTERLALLDGVMSLLPYGMRAQLAASTWTSGTYRAHKFRLFFSDAPRSGFSTDQVVRLETTGLSITRTTETRVPLELTDSYEEWLRVQPREALARRLAAATDPVSFRPDDIQRTLDWVMAPASRRLPDATDLGEPSASPRGPRLGARLLPSRENRGVAKDEDTRRAEELLAGCVSALGRQSPIRLTVAVAQLEELLSATDRRGEEQGLRIWNMFGQDSRLTRFLAAGDRRAAFYEFLRRVAGTGVIDYESYRLAEDIIGGRPHLNLLLAIDAVPGDDFIVKMITRHYLGGAYPQLPLRELFTLAVSPLDLRPDHARILIGRAVLALEDAPPAELDDVRILLAEQGYLAPVLARREPDDLPYQVDALTAVLQAIAGGGLTTDAVRDILAGSSRQPPTLALLLAALRLTRPNAVNDVLHVFMTRLAGSAGLGGDLRDVLVSRGFTSRRATSREDLTVFASEESNNDV
jgi:hypothetical protein